MRKVLARILIFLCAAAVLAGAGWCGWQYFQENYIIWNRAVYRRDTGALDLRGHLPEDLEALHRFPDLKSIDVRDTGMTVEQYEWLRAEFLGCDVAWELPFQGGYYSLDTQSITLTSLTEEDILLLDYLPELTTVDARECPDTACLVKLQAHRPACRVLYRVSVGGWDWDWDTTGMELVDADHAELAEKLTYLPELKELTLTGRLPEAGQLERLQEQYPQINITWKTETFGLLLTKQTTELDLRDSGISSVSQLEDLLGYLPALETVDITGCGLDQDGLLGLMARWPEVYFRCQLRIGGRTFSTDVEEMDLSNLPFEGVEEVESLLHCFPNLRKVVMCECGIDYEEMDALDKRHENIRFVWSVRLAGMLFRTDAIYFTPNKYGLVCTDDNIYDLRYCVDMVCVDIGHSENVTNCGWAAFMPRLKYLVLADSGVQSAEPLAGLQELAFLELFQSKVRDYTPLTHCAGLRDLNLCYTYGDPTPLAQMTWLERLWWSGCPWKGRKLLQESLADTQLEFSTVSSTGSGWREGQLYYDMRDFIGMDYMTG